MHGLGQDWTEYRVLNLNLKTLCEQYPFVMLSGHEFCKSDIIFMMMCWVTNSMACMGNLNAYSKTHKEGTANKGTFIMISK